MRKLLLIGLLCCLCGMLGAQNKKSDLKVLYVGGSADLETFGVKVDSAALQKSVAERTASFEKMLKADAHEDCPGCRRQCDGIQEGVLPHGGL